MQTLTLAVLEISMFSTFKILFVVFVSHCINQMQHILSHERNPKGKIMSITFSSLVFYTYGRKGREGRREEGREEEQDQG